VNEVPQGTEVGHGLPIVGILGLKPWVGVKSVLCYNSVISTFKGIICQFH
jgi:hypothetical protein